MTYQRPPVPPRPQRVCMCMYVHMHPAHLLFTQAALSKATSRCPEGVAGLSLRQSDLQAGAALQLRGALRLKVRCGWRLMVWWLMVWVTADGAGG